MFHKLAITIILYSVKMVSDSISEHLFFKIFLGGMSPDPPSFSMLRTLIVLCMNSPLETAQKGPTSILYGPSPLQPWTLCPGNNF